MAASFGGNQMMMQPQNSAANSLQQYLIQQIQQSAGHVKGWQASVGVRERFSLVWQMVSQLRLVNGQPDTREICTMTLQFEKGAFDTAPDKETYTKVIREKMDTLTQARTQNGVNTQAQIQAQAQVQAHQAQAHAQAQALVQAQRQAQPHQMIMANHGALQGQLQRAGMGQQPQQPLHHLQHQMQASPIPAPQQPLQVPMGMVNNGLPPHMANQQQQQQQFQMNMQQQQQIQHPMPPEKRQQPGPNTFTTQEQAVIANMVQNMLKAMSEEDKQNRRNQIRAQMEPTILAKCQTQGVDPLVMQLRNQAIHMLRQKKMQSFNEMQLQQSRSRQGHANAPSSAPMQHQRSGNPSAINGQGPQQPPMGVNQEFGSFAGGVGDMVGQHQAAGVLAQDAGQMVVPVSMPQGNPTSQGLQGPQIGANAQRPLSNPNARPQSTQQAFNSQRAPSQAQLRAGASAKAQQMALQGQPGGMGPMPPAQSPAMTTLNAPLRTPQQPQAANPVDSLQSNQPNMTQFGAPLDPRFAQGNQPRNGQGGVMDGMALNGAMFPPHMPSEIRQRIMALPKDQLNDTLRRWNAAHQGQAGKPHAGMLMNVQGARPNQLVNQDGQFNRQGMPNQFVNGNQNGQQQHSMMANLNAQQQQQLLLKQRMAQMPQQLRRGPNGQGVMSLQEQHANQIEQLEFPQNIRLNPQLRGIPHNVTRWGELRRWASQNSVAALETVKQTQQLHFATHMRERGMQQQQRQQQPGGLMNGTGMVPPQNAPPGAPGMAPVAPMGQQPLMSVDLGPTVISAEDIQKVRAYTNGKWTTASDDEIKQQLVKNHHSAQQRKTLTQRQMAMARMAQSQPLQPPNQAGAQRAPQPAPPRPPNPHQAPKQGGRSQPGVPPTGAQQPPVGSDMTTPNPPNARAPRSAQPAKANPPGAPQPPKNNLKRASSDDLVEMQDPHVQQQPRPAAQQTGSLARPVPSGRGAPGADPAASWASTAQPQSQQQASRITATETQRYQAIVQEEMSRSGPLPVIQTTPEVKQAAHQKLKAMAAKVRGAKMALPKWFAISKNEDKLRKILRAYHVMALQFHDQDLTKPLKDQLSINPSQIEQVVILTQSLITDLTNKFPALSKSGNGVVGAGPAPNANQLGPNATPAVPLNAENLQQQQQSLEENSHKKAPSRSNSRNNAPPAPTSAHPPPFPPDGFAKQLTADQLRLPKSKKAKFTASTPLLGQQSQGPKTAQPAKQGSPEVKLQQPPHPAEPKKTGFYCPEPHCDHHFLDEFPDAEALERHREEEHVRPVQDPKKYALDHLALITRVDQDGVQKASRPLALLGSASGSKVENIPAGTPMNRQSSVNGVQASPANSRVSKTPKADTPTAARPTNAELDLIDLASTFDDDLWASSAVNPQELVHNFQSMETGAGGAISDMSVYRSITPNDTPESSKDGLSEPTSDISEGLDLSINLDFVDLNHEWKPFGLSDMDSLLDLDALNVNRDDEMTGVLEGDATQFVPWSEFMDPAAFDKPFTFDQNFFSLNVD